MNRRALLAVVLLFALLRAPGASASGHSEYLSALNPGQQVADFRVAHLYSDADGKVVGAKFFHVATGTPVFLLEIETAPQVFTWIDAPIDSNKGLPHALEHLLAGKGTKGRYFTLLRGVRFAQSEAATVRDFNFYGLASGAGLDDFFQLFHAWLDALYRPDFTDLEAEREFYHFGVTTDSKTQKKILTEEGSVYHEMEAGQGRYTYYFALNKRVFGEHNPLAFHSGGIPDEMRGVTPDEIRRYQARYYRLGPATGFIFAVDPKGDVAGFLQKLSRELRRYIEPASPPVQAKHAAGEPKYPIASSEDLEPGIYPFPGGSEAAPGIIHFAWKPVKTDSLVELKLLQLLFLGFAGEEQSLLHKSIVDRTTRELDSGATGVDSEVFLANSPYFPVGITEVSGIPGNRISREMIEKIRKVVGAKMKELSEYPDESKALAEFNEMVATYAKASRRSESVWIRNVPGFGSGQFKTDWKERFAYLEMDPAFIRSLSTEGVWQAIDAKLKSRRNIWREVIQQFHLLDLPYVTASVPSPQLLSRLEKEKQERITQKTKVLMEQYHTDDQQEALSRFQQDELAKTNEIDRIEARVPRPAFTQNPPMTPDDAIRYKQFELGSVPVIASIFERPPTLDIGLSFDLSKIPSRYFKYFPIFPRCLDSIGLKHGDRITSYSELLAKIQKEVYAFSVGYDSNPTSKRMELTINASGANDQELRAALSLIREIIQFNYLDLNNVDRLRDVLARRLSADESYTKRDGWTTNPAYSFRYQDDPLYLALFSQLTRAHWDARLSWLLHTPVSAEEIDRLSGFAERILEASHQLSKQDLSQKLATANAKGLQAELVDYWKKNLDSFAEAELQRGLRQLTNEVQEDLRQGPAKTIEELKTLQTLIFDRRALRVDLTVDQMTLDKIQPDVVGFMESIPLHQDAKAEAQNDKSLSHHPIMAKLEKRYALSSDVFPWYVGLINPDGITANVIFYADFSGYSRLDRDSLVRVLSTKLLAGSGPQSAFMKTWEAGLAYDDGIISDPGRELMWYYANRVSDIPSLLSLVDSLATKIRGLHDKFLVDYALRQTFPLPRSVATFSERGKALARDLKDGNGPEQIRHFSEAILRLRQDPNLLQKLTAQGLDAICGVMLMQECISQHRSVRSIFFFAGPEKILSDTESRVPIPKLLRIWPSDYWIE